MASFNGCFYMHNGSYVEITITEHKQRKRTDREYAKRKFITTAGGYLLEVPLADYRAITREANRQQYLNRGQSSISLYQLCEGECLLLDALEDPSVDIETSAISNVMAEEVRAVLRLLGTEDYALYRALFIEGLSEREYASLLGVSQSSVQRRKAGLIVKLRAYFGLQE